MNTPDVAPLFEGALLRQIDVGARVAAVEVRVPGESAVLVLGVTKNARGVGLVTKEARREAWGARLPLGTTRSRTLAAGLENGRVVGIGEHGIEIDRNGVHHVLAVGAAKIALGPGTLPAHASEDERSAYETRGRELVAALREEALAHRREQMARDLRRGIGKVERRIRAMQGDVARLADAEALAAQAQWLVAAAVKAPRGATELTVTDWSTGEARELKVPLDPAKPARAQVEAMFQRARRLKRGAHIAEERIAKATMTREGLERELSACLAAEDDAALDRAWAKARALSPKDVSASAQNPGGGGGTTPKSAPFRTFVTSGGARILVGKGAAHNDKLTFQNARPHDLWLHAKGRTGAHVIVPLAKNSSCPAELLVDAAHLAAHFSEARGEAVVEVQYTPRKYLRKPKGSAPGLVVVDREKVLGLRTEPGKVESLLESEDHAVQAAKE